MARPITNNAYIVIDHKRYGARTEFDSLTEAVASIRSMGDEWNGVTLEVHGWRVIDERNEVIGYLTH